MHCTCYTIVFCIVIQSGVLGGLMLPSKNLLAIPKLHFYYVIWKHGIQELEWTFEVGRHSY